MVTIQVQIPDDKDAQWLADTIWDGLLFERTVEVGQGQRINGIPLNVILVTVQD